MTRKTPSLSAAYALKTSADSVALYRDWANTYDSGFAGDMDYRLPQLVALIFAEMGVGKSPVLDVGAGTGLLAQNLPVGGMLDIDALDISAEMLEVAGRKNLYRKLIQADLTQTLEIADGTYGAVVSSGTFTHGHVGPDALDELLRIARAGAVFVLAINAEYFVAHGFETKLAELAPRLDDPTHHLVNIYGPDAPDDHKEDKARIAVFTKR
jgi:SAM-dependent methyltransferase